MSLWRHFTRGMTALVRKNADRNLADEVDQYLEEAAAALVASGVSPDEARRRVRLDAGSATLIAEQVRSAGWEHFVATTLGDLTYGARRLRRSPGLTLVAAVTLALGIGATTAVFSAVNPILIEPLPYPHASRVVIVWDHARDGSRIPITFGTYREVAQRNHSFEALAVTKPFQPTLTGGTEPERLDGQAVSARYFSVVGVRPLLGRDFQDADDRVKGPRVVMLSDGLWRRRFAADPAVVGRDIVLNDIPFTIVGVLPPFENVLEPSADVWTTLQYDTSLPPDGREWGHHLTMVGRVLPEATVNRAQQDLDAIARNPIAEFARVRWASLAQGLTVIRLQEDLTRAVRPALLAIGGGAMLLLMLACVNVANLLLARSAQRRGEFAMRAALGAGRGRLIRQMLTESLLLATIGGVAGMGVAVLGVGALVALSPAELPRAAAIGLDVPVFVFALGITALVGVVVGVIPAFHSARAGLHAGLQQTSHRTAGRRQATRHALVVAEVAIALVLLVSAGLLVRSLQQLFAISPGFDGSHVLTMQVQTSGRRYDMTATRRFFAEAVDAVRRVPGVEAAGFTSQLPLTSQEERYGVHFEGDDPKDDRAALRYTVTPGYLTALGIPLRRGRLLDVSDAAGAPVAVLINESLAKRRSSNGDPIGQRLHLGSTDVPWYTVVGIVADVKQTSLAVDNPDAVYITTDQWYFADQTMSLVVRAAGDASALTNAVRRAIWSIGKDQPITRVATMEQLLARSAAERRFARALFEAFAIVALVLAATGIYGVLSGSVAERTREIGVRAALGASRTQIVALIGRQGLALTAVGITLGLAGAIGASRAIVTLLFGVSPLDPVTYVGVIAVLVGVAATACCIPAWRAAWIDPAVTLRAE